MGASPSAIFMLARPLKHVVRCFKVEKLKNFSFERIFYHIWRTIICAREFLTFKKNHIFIKKKIGSFFSVSSTILKVCLFDRGDSGASFDIFLDVLWSPKKF